MNTDDFINNLGVFCFQPHILQPTRITDHTATLIDNICFNSIEHCCISGNLVCDISDHFPNFLFINKLSCSSNQIIYRRDYSVSLMEKNIEDVQSVKWEDALPATEDVNNIFESFHTKLTEIIDNR